MVHGPVFLLYTLRSGEVVMEEGATTEDVVSKYKRLLSLARSNLEANQLTIAEKDRQIASLKASLESETAKLKRLQTSYDEEGSVNDISRLLRRVHVNNRNISSVWLLAEYSERDDAWMKFKNEQEVDEFLVRYPHLSKPPQSLSPEQSAEMEANCKRTVDRIVEEFRRYKVKSEIALKQKESDAKTSPFRHATSPTPTGNSSTLFSTDHSLRDELHRLQKQLADTESRWKSAYEALSRENESLRAHGGEAAVAGQWRERYEQCATEKDELLEKLKLYTSDGHVSAVNGDSKSYRQLYNELKEEYTDFRRKLLAIEQEKQRKKEMKRLENSMHSLTAKAKDNSMDNSAHNYESARFQYIRNLILQYLSCRDVEVKMHIEHAIVTIFRYDESDREKIELRRKDESGENSTTLGSISSLFTSFQGIGT